MEFHLRDLVDGVQNLILDLVEEVCKVGRDTWNGGQDGLVTSQVGAKNVNFVANHLGKVRRGERLIANRFSHRVSLGLSPGC